MRIRIEEYIGLRFASWVVQSFDRIDERGRQFWFFRCDCGNVSSVAQDQVRGGRSKRCRNCSNKAASYKTGRHITPKGYVLLSGYWFHPNKDCRGRVFEHVMLMAGWLGRPLIKGETVHHKNGKRADNSRENLELWYRGQPAGQRVEDLILYLESTGYRVEKL